MKKYSKLFASGICALLIISVLSISAAAEKADIKEAPEVSSVPEPLSSENEVTAQPSELPEQVAAEASPAAEKAEADTADAESGDEALICAKGQELYAEANTVVFNNGGTVYNNGALVYNNGGICYNNLGLVYNNGGTVYANGGSVYDNGGSVYNYGAELFTHTEFSEVQGEEPEAETAEAENPEKVQDESADKKAATEDTELFTVKYDENYLNAVDFEPVGDDGKISLSAEAQCRISAKPGYVISFAEADAGALSLESDGSYILRDLDEDAVLSIEYRPTAPEFSLKSGVYGEEQRLEINSDKSMTVYYTLDGSEPGEKSEKYEKPLKLKESCTVRAVALSEEGLGSEICEAEINILDVEVPEFKSVKEDYHEIEPKALVIKNPGTLDVEIKNIVLKGENAGAFTINHTAGQRIPAGETEAEFWTLAPALGLKKGEYTASLCLQFAHSDDLIYEINFKVK